VSTEAAALRRGRRKQLITAATASVQGGPGFPVGGVPVVTETCALPFESVMWLAALQVVTGRCGEDPGPGWPSWAWRCSPGQIRSAMPGWGGQQARRAICGRVFAALTDSEDVVVSCRRACSAGSPMSWATWPGPGPSCGPWRPTWRACWTSSACSGWRTSWG
jgi:hypothetical protein